MHRLRYAALSVRNNVTVTHLLSVLQKVTQLLRKQSHFSFIAR